MSDSFSRVQAETIEVEVLPPQGRRRGTGPATSTTSTPPMGSANPLPVDEAEALPRLIALVMDNLFPLPGTKRRFGLNPFLDLVPIFGDGAAAVVSTLTLLVAARLRVPKVVMIRMSINIMLNAAIGTIPAVGEAFAFLFRPSMRNYALLKKYLSEDGIKPAPASTRGDWVFVLTLLGVVGMGLVGFIVLGAYLLYAVLHALFGS